MAKKRLGAASVRVERWTCSVYEPGEMVIAWSGGRLCDVSRRAPTTTDRNEPIPGVFLLSWEYTARYAFYLELA